MSNTSNETEERLIDMCEDICNEIREVKISGFDYLDDVLDINYITTQDKMCKGARLLVAFGGPNIWIDTASQEVEGYWGSDRVTRWYSKDYIGLDDACAELYDMA